jgi:hypothetical protein
MMSSHYRYYWWVVFIIILSIRVFNFVVLGLSFLVAVVMASWAGVGDHRWKRYVLMETSVFLAVRILDFFFFGFFGF